MPALQSCLRRALTMSLMLGVGLVAVGAGALSRSASPLTGKPETLAAQPAGKPQPRTDRLGDPLPPGTLFRIGTTRLQHGDYVWAVAASPDGKLLAAVSNDHSLSLWDPATGKEVQRMALADVGDAWLAFTPDSKSLALNRGGKFCLFDVATREVKKTLGSTARTGVFAADGKTVTVVQDDGGIWSPAIRRWDLAIGKPLKEWQFRPEPPAGDGAVLGVRHDFNVATWLSADATTLISLESDRANFEKPKQMLRLHDVATGKETRRWQVPAPEVHDVALSSDGKFVITASATTVTRVWEVATTKEVRRWRSDPRDDIHYGSLHLAFTPDGDTLLARGPDGLIRWDWRTGKKLHTYPSTWGPIAFLNDGKAMAVIGYVNSLWVFDVETGKDLCPLPRPDHHVAFSPDGRLVAWPEAGALVLADAATGNEVRCWQDHHGVIGPLTFAPDGKSLATRGADKRIHLWNVADGREIRSMPHDWVSRLVFSADGSRLVSAAGWHSDVCAWDLASGERRGSWEGDRLTTVDPGARVIAVADRKAGVLRLADAVTGKTLHTLPGYQERVGHHYHQTGSSSGSHGDFPPLFSPDGRVLLAGGTVPNGDKDGAVYFWDVPTGKRLPHILDGNKFIFNNIAFAPDSKLLALQRSDLMLCLMDAATGDVVRTLGQPSSPMTAPPAYTADGCAVVTVVKGLIQVWEVATGGEICRREGHRGDVDALVIAGDGRSLATVAWDHTILVWDLARMVSAAPQAGPAYRSRAGRRLDRPGPPRRRDGPPRH